MHPKADWAPAFRAKTTFEALACDSVQAYFHSSPSCATMRRSLFSYLPGELGGYNVGSSRPRMACATDDPLALIQYP
jgi:asparagine synthase (glutamine-hydrolysing)